MMLTMASVFAQKLGWEEMEFETAEDAYAFVERQIKKGNAPSQANPRARPKK
jgi:hypothetical protein